jgi:hypothetical protein
LTPLYYVPIFLHNALLKTSIQGPQPNTHQGKRLFIKDITHYLVPPSGAPASIAPSLTSYKRGVGTDTTALPTPPASSPSSSGGPPYPYATDPEPGNPTVVPADLLTSFHFTFLIRHPRASIPSYFRCTVPPLDAVTGFYNFMPSEAGYDEVRRVFEYLRSIGAVGPRISGQAAVDAKEGGETGVEICVVDADDLLDNPAGMIEAYCKSVGLEYTPEMLKWESEEDHRVAKEAFEKWKGFHEDAIESTELKPRLHVSFPSMDSVGWIGLGLGFERLMLA